MKWHEKKEVQDLRKKWYKILEEDGFEDIEQVVDRKGNVGCLLLGVSAGDLRRRLYKEETEDYYRFARQHAHSLQPGTLRRVIWELHAEGLSAPKIRKRIERIWGKHTRKKILDIIRAEKHRMLTKLDAEVDAQAKAAKEAWDESEEG